MDQAAATTADKLGTAVDVETPGFGTTDGAAAPVAAAASAKGKHLYAGREWTADHPVNVRISIPFVFGRYYLTLVAGKERRTRARLAADRRQHPLDTPSNVVFVFFISIVATAGSLTLAYLMLAHLLGWPGRFVY